ncbi:MAG: hypothetical protein LBK72_08505, partial [Bifidobacteriaceae bacterium]|nr:hypothetical protein [Bifidobacteriaceae bacterium]
MTIPAAPIPRPTTTSTIPAPSTPTGATCLGYPRQGSNRQLKKAVEAYWAGRTTSADLLEAARQVRLERLATLREAGLTEIPSNDFSLYDHVLDTAWMLGAIPPRFTAAMPARDQETASLDCYFALARGADGLEPLEMTKWFDTNYHYLVPELSPTSRFTLNPAKVLAEFDEAKTAGVVTRPVVLGPVSFLLLSKPDRDNVDDGAPALAGSAEFQPLDLLDRVLPLYCDLLAQLAAHGAGWVQLDEPCLVLDQPAQVLERTAHAYQVLGAAPERPRLLVATYFGVLAQALPILAASPAEGLAIDFAGPAAANLEHLERIGGLGDKRLVAGLIDGRNIWAADLGQALTRAERLAGCCARLDVAASCSLMHVPLDVTEEDVPAELAGWLAFARQKLDEVTTVARGLAEGRAAVSGALGRNAATRRRRAESPLTRVASVRARVAAVRSDDARRATPGSLRAKAQLQATALPELPTTTIGSFPQTAEVRAARAAWAKGTMTDADYQAAMRAEIAPVIDAQEQLGLDVLVHGEAER